jgi:serine phosphatase RsbU (regulator of sigma subunit)
MLRRVFLTVAICLLGSIVMPLTTSAASEEKKLNYIQEIGIAKKNHDYERLGNLIVGRTGKFYNNGWTDSILLHVPEDLQTLGEIEQWDRYYETWTYLVNTLIYYSNSKNKALREVQAMYDDAKRRNNEKGMGIAYYTMGNVYLNMNNLDESANAYKKGLEILLKIKPLLSVVSELYSYYGDVLNEQQRFMELDKLTVGWKTYLEELIKENTESFKQEQIEILWFLYDVACVQAATGLGDYQRAQKVLDEAYQYVHSEEDYLASTWLTVAAQLKLKQGRFMEALHLNNRRMDLVDPTEDRGVYLSVAAQRTDILEGLHRYEELSKLYKRMYFLKDSLNSADTKSQLAEMNSILHVDELEREQQRLKMEQERLKMEQERAQFRNMLIIGGLVLVSLVVFIVFRTIAARRLKKAHDQLQATHEELLTAYDQLEETTAAKERIESDLRIARNIQMGMVPRTFPSRPDLDLYGSMTPAKEVGGDLYGYYLAESSEEGKSDKLYFCLGDVSGKGVPASLFMAQATRLFCTLAAQEMMPAEIATRINNALSGEDNETGMFVTMFLGLLDLQTGHLDFCNAGHNPPVLLRDGKPEFIEMVPNAPVGIIPELDFEGEEIADITNCPLFIYTDGLNEAENREKEQFTDERLLEIMEQVPFENCQQTIEMLREEVEKHRDGAEPNDDLTMLCVKFIKEENNS